MAISRVESYPYPVKEGQRYINLNPGKTSIGFIVTSFVYHVTGM